MHIFISGNVTQEYSQRCQTTIHGLKISENGKKIVYRDGEKPKTTCFDLKFENPSKDLQLVWEKYITYISAHLNDVEVETKEAGKERIETIQAAIKKINPDYNRPFSPLEGVEKDPKRYLKIARKLQRSIKHLFFENTREEKVLIFYKGCFQEDLDYIERHTLKILDDIFSHHIAEGNVEEAKKFIATMPSKFQSSLAYYQLALHCFKERRYTDMFSELEQMNYHPELDERLQSLTKMLFLSMKEDDLTIHLSHMKNKGIVKVLILNLIDQLITEDDASHAKKIIIDTTEEGSQRDDICISVIEKLGKEENFDLAKQFSELLTSPKMIIKAKKILEK